MNLKAYLQKLGLDEIQSEIYLELSKSSATTVVTLARKLNKPRSSLYLELEKLITKGFVIASKEENTTTFKITPLNSLKYQINSEQQKVQDLFDGFDDFVTNIQAHQTAYKSVYSVNNYKGQEGIKQLLWNILNSGAKEVIGFSPSNLESITDHEFAESWRLEFKLRGMHNRIILNETVPLNWSQVPGFLSENVEARTLEEKKIKFERELLIYNDTLVVISSKEDPEQYGVELNDKLLVSSYRQLFDLLWNEMAKKIPNSN
jgi:sugar-specific transcriptional regulator TrmB